MKKKNKSYIFLYFKNKNTDISPTDYFFEIRGDLSADRFFYFAERYKRLSLSNTKTSRINLRAVKTSTCLCWSFYIWGDKSCYILCLISQDKSWFSQIVFECWLFWVSNAFVETMDIESTWLTESFTVLERWYEILVAFWMALATAFGSENLFFPFQR